MWLIKVAVFLMVAVMTIVAENTNCSYEIRCRFNDPNMRFCVPRYHFVEPVSPRCTRDSAPAKNPKGTCDPSKCGKTCDDFWPWDDPPTCDPGDAPTKVVKWNRQGRKPFVSPINRVSYKHCPPVQYVQCNDPRLQTSTSATDGKTTGSVSGEESVSASQSSISAESGTHTTAEESSTMSTSSITTDSSSTDQPTSSATSSSTAESSSTSASITASEASSTSGKDSKLVDETNAKSEKSESGLDPLLIAMIVLFVLALVMAVIGLVAWKYAQKQAKSKRAEDKGGPKADSIENAGTDPMQAPIVEEPKKVVEESPPQKAIGETAPKKEPLSLTGSKTGPPSTRAPITGPPKKSAGAPKSISARASPSSRGFAIDYEEKVGSKVKM